MKMEKFESGQHENDDASADRKNIASAENADGKQDGEGRFRAVSCRAECIEPKDGHSGSRADLLRSLLRGA